MSRMAVWLLLGLSACSAGGGGKVQDAAVDVLTFDWLWGDLPAGCPPMAANDRGVGGPCTRNGKECGDKLHCACDNILTVQPPENTPCFCTVLSFATCEMALQADPNHCGQDATCCGTGQSAEIVASLCVPNACLEMMTCPPF